MLGLAAWPWLAQAQRPGAEILVPHDVRQDFDRFLAGRGVTDLRHYGGPHARRDVVELALLLQALSLGGQSALPSLASVPTAPRLIRELALGHGLMSGTTYWRADVDAPQDFLFSPAMVQDGEFVVGLYTLPERADVLASRDLAEVKDWRFVSNRHWRVDWASLQALGVTQLVHADLWEAMPRMLRAGRADVLLAPFQPTPDLALVVDGITLLPVPGLKVALRGTRHYLLAKRHPAATRWAEALGRGLKLLQEQGAVRRAYQESGFFSSAVTGWRLL